MTGRTLGVFLLACSALAAGGAPQERGDAAVAGLWQYETLTPAKGPTIRLNGFFLFKDGYFVQEALNLCEPFQEQLVQAHAGTYSVGADRSVRIVTDVQLAIRPGRVPPVVSNPGRTHELTPSRQGDQLTLTFGSGTVQTFRRAGPGSGRFVLLDKGALALVDGRFVLVAESEGAQVVAAGRAEASGSRLALHAERWATAAARQVQYQRDVRIDAELDAGQLRIPGLPTLRVQSGHR